MIKVLHMVCHFICNIYDTRRAALPAQPEHFVSDRARTASV